MKINDDIITHGMPPLIDVHEMMFLAKKYRFGNVF